MNASVDDLIERYSSSGVLVDTNLLLLYFVGSFDETLIPRFKRTVQFLVEDYATLRTFLSFFRTVLTTPHILTEVSNLSSQIAEPAKTDFFDKFSAEIELLEEHYIQSVEASRRDEFAKFGLTDCGIVHLGLESHLVLTNDWRLANYLGENTIPVLNFNHIRLLGWQA